MREQTGRSRGEPSATAAMVDKTNMQEICLLLAGSLVPGVQTVEVDYTVTAHGVSSHLILNLESGENQDLAVPARAAELLSELRGKMLEPGKGTWWRAIIKIDHSGSYTARFNYEQPPDENVISG